MYKRKKLYQLVRNSADLMLLALAAFVTMAYLTKSHAYGTKNPLVDGSVCHCGMACTGIPRPFKC